MVSVRVLEAVVGSGIKAPVHPGGRAVTGGRREGGRDKPERWGRGGQSVNFNLPGRQVAAEATVPSVGVFRGVGVGGTGPASS